jgi:hypothetical protein
MKFYLYDQNNAGGGFDVNDKVTTQVLIEAPSEKRADAIAESIGIYFDGFENDRDCPCCGDRWRRASDYDAVEQDKVEEADDNYAMRWVKEGEPWRHIYFADGSKKSLIREKKSLIGEK